MGSPERLKIEIMDTTLRDGEQTSGVSFMPHEKLLIARLLLQKLNVDRIEVASARVSDGEKRAVSLICKWARSAGMLPRVEVLGFVDHTTSVDWIRACGGQCINLLCKGSLKHCRHQLKKSPEEHLADILQTLEYAHSRQVEANIYLEDWSNGIQESPDYVFFLIDHLRQAGIRRFMLPDTAKPVLGQASQGAKRPQGRRRIRRRMWSLLRTKSVFHRTAEHPMSASAFLPSQDL